MRAEGFWAWWNQYGHESIEMCVQRVKAAGLAGVIVKYGYPQIHTAFAEAGIPWATERYTYPYQPTVEATWLAEDVARGAQFAVINAEKEWENQPAGPMQQLIDRFRELQPHAELYASVDTRGNRTNLPYQQVLGENIVAWMPMVYPLAFYKHRPMGYVASAFRDCLDGKSFQGKPVLPTIQTYHDIGVGAVEQEMAEVAQRGLPGCQAYTVGHATGAEWQAFSDAIPEEDEMTPEEKAKLNEAHVLATANKAHLNELVSIVGSLGERIVGTENWIKFHQAVLEIFRNRLAFNDELTVRLWAAVFPGEDVPPDPEGALEERIAALEALHNITKEV